MTNPPKYGTIDEIDYLLRQQNLRLPDAWAVACATVADREDLLTEFARRAEAGGYRMMKIVPAADDDAGWQQGEAIKRECHGGHALLLVVGAEDLPAHGEPGWRPLNYWATQHWSPVLLVVVGCEGRKRLDIATARGDLNRHCGAPLDWP